VKEAVLFLKKKHQKNFWPGVRGVETDLVTGAKVFCGAFFQKSDILYV
jgi:hypothetical protein